MFLLYHIWNGKQSVFFGLGLEFLDSEGRFSGTRREGRRTLFLPPLCHTRPPPSGGCFCPSSIPSFSHPLPRLGAGVFWPPRATIVVVGFGEKCQFSMPDLFSEITSVPCGLNPFPYPIFPFCKSFFKVLTYVPLLLSSEIRRAKAKSARTYILQPF